MREIEITPKQYEQIARTVYDFCGIKLGKEKQNLVKSRLTKRLNKLELPDFDAYLDLTGKDQKEFTFMIDSLTTNKTDFFRELPHFDFLAGKILPNLMARKRSMRIWSAACSSGEEPYSIGMALHDSIPDIGKWDIKILATDISSRILEKAMLGEYEQSALGGIDSHHLQKYFAQTPGHKFRVNDPVKRMVRFARLNLMSQWKMQGPFDLIFCRNVMIYFDKKTQEALVNRFYNLLEKGGYLFVGHSESLNGVNHRYDYVKPAIYLK